MNYIETYWTQNIKRNCDLITNMLLWPRLAVRRSGRASSWATNWRHLQTFCSQFLKEESCKLLSRKPPFSKAAERGHGSATHVTVYSIQIFISPTSFPMASSPPRRALDPEPTVCLTFAVFHEGKEGSCLCEGHRHGMWGLPVSYTDFQPIFLSPVSPAPQILRLAGGSEV